MNAVLKNIALFFLSFALSGVSFASGRFSKLENYVSQFNRDDVEIYKTFIPNSEAGKFLSENIPLFECPDSDIEKTYYFRWWTFRKHIKQTEGNSYVVTEFLPKVFWAGKYNAISCPAGHHFAEGRWLRNGKYLASYAYYWFDCGKDIRNYSFGPAHSILEFYKVHQDKVMLSELYRKMADNFSVWENTHRDSNGLFWQSDHQDGMEISISGYLHKKHEGYRATINSYMYGECEALAQIASILGRSEDSARFLKKAEEIKKNINALLWDNRARFYKVIPRSQTEFSSVRELHGYTPWYYNIPPFSYSDAFKQLSDNKGFNAPFGLTTAEQRHCKFAINYSGHECQWNGPSWPFATSITLVGLANFLNDYPPSPHADKKLFFDILKTYAISHRRVLNSGKQVMWIDENINPYTGDWISRTRLENWNGKGWSQSKGGKERGKDYNHSQFCNHIISGLVGIRANLDSSIVVNPLVPDSWDWFCLENLAIKNRNVSVYFDRRANKYGLGEGLFVVVDGKVRAHSKGVAKLKIDLGE